jgi:hypothetical protein
MYTSQIKNSIINNKIDIYESPCLVITPLFSLANYLPYRTFGHSSKISRITVLLMCLFCISLVFYIGNQYFKSILLISIPLILFEFHIFHFTHYSLAEMPAITSIFLGCFFLYKSIINKQNITIFSSAMFFTFSYLFKIQFLYIFFLVPLFFLNLIIFQKISSKKLNIEMKTLSKHFIYMTLLLLLYVFCWYLPNKDFINHLLEYGFSSRLIESSELNVLGMAVDYLLNLKAFFFTFYKEKYILVIFLMIFPLGLYLLFSKNSSKFFKIIFLISLSWFMIEMHKFSMNYLPSRYLLSLYFPIGIIISIVSYESWKLYVNDKNYFICFCYCTICCFTLLSFNVYSIKTSYNSRTYDIKETNIYFERYNYNNRPIMGSWASSLARNNKVLTLPIFEDYYNHENIIEEFNPKVIILEDIDGDLLKKDNIILNEISDSVVSKTVGEYELKIVWLK